MIPTDTSRNLCSAMVQGAQRLLTERAMASRG
jgi:hypothetical protein